MSNSRSISILSVFSWGLVLSFLCGCAQTKKKTKTLVSTPGECRETDVLVEERHLVMSAKNQKQANLIACFQNYLKFEQQKQQQLFTCNQISIRRNGTVSYVQTTSSDKRALPRDLEMCLEQEFWKMNFSGLQIERSYIISFPLNFSSIVK